MNRIPKPFFVIYQVLSAILNILGFASIAEGFVTWVGFVADVVDTYHRYLRDPILHFIDYFWPASWPKLPAWVIDVLILQSSFFISYHLFMAFEKVSYRIVFRRIPFLETILIFLGGPLFPFLQLGRLRVKGRRELIRARQEAKEGARADLQHLKYGSTNLPLLSEEGWIALDKRQLASLEAIDLAKSTFVRLNIYYGCYLLLILVLLFVAYQIGHLKQA